MKLVERIKNICLSPKTEWPVIAEENTPHKTLITGYLLPLASLSALAGFIGGSVVGHSLPFIGSYRVPIATGLSIAVFSIIMAVVGTVLLGVIINALAPTFGGSKNPQQAFKVAVYSYTPAWVAGLFYMLPLLSFIAIIGAFYGLYLLYLGLPRLMNSAEDKSVAYTAVVIISALVLSFLINLSVGIIASFGVMTQVLPQSVSDASDVQFDKDSPFGKLQNFSKKMEGINEKMEDAKKQGDQNQQMALALEGLGTMLGGGKKIDPLTINQLVALLPQSFAGLPGKTNTAERTGALGVQVSKAEAIYTDDAGKKVTLEISDMGGVSGLLSLASWVNAQGEKIDENGSEKTEKIDGRMVHEKSSKNGDNEFSIVIAERFMLSAKAQGIDTAALKDGVMGLNLDQLEALKDQDK